MRNGKICKKTIAVLVVLLSAALLPACATFDSFTHTFIDKGFANSDDKIILIGVFEPQSGRYSDEGLSEIKGIELANSIYNTVNGYRVKIAKVDTQSSTSAGETAIKALIEMDPVAIIGSAGEATSILASKHIDKAKIPTITPSATNPLITLNHKFYFRASITGSQMGSGIAEYAYNELGSRHIGIVTATNDTASTALLDGFNDTINEYANTDSEVYGNVGFEAVDGTDNSETGPVVMSGEVSQTDNDFSEIIKELKRKHVDVVIAPLGTETMGQFFTAVEKAGLKGITFIGTKNWGNADFLAMMEEHRKIKVVFPYQSVINNDSDTITKEAVRFRILYQNKYGIKDVPNDYAALGYDSYLLLMNAIHNAESLKGSDIRKALLNLRDVKCVTGNFTFDENGNTVRAVNISTIKDGEIVSVYMTGDTVASQEIEELNK